MSFRFVEFYCGVLGECFLKFDGIVFCLLDIRGG